MIDEREANLVAEALSSLPESSTVRVTRPVRSHSGRWIVDGWSAWLRLLGTELLGSWREALLTALGDWSGIDCVSRVFAPKFGVPEDPVTGSAHCVLALLWANRLGRTALIGEQASSRGGIVRMQMAGYRVKLSDQAVTTAHVQVVM